MVKSKDIVSGGKKGIARITLNKRKEDERGVIHLFSRKAPSHENQDRVFGEIMEDYVIISAIDGVSGEYDLGTKAAKTYVDILSNLRLDIDEIKGKKAVDIGPYIRQKMREISELPAESALTIGIQFFDEHVKKYRTINLWVGDGGFSHLHNGEVIFPNVYHEENESIVLPFDHAKHILPFGFYVWNEKFVNDALVEIIEIPQRFSLETFVKGILETPGTFEFTSDKRLPFMVFTDGLSKLINTYFDMKDIEYEK